MNSLDSAMFLPVSRRRRSFIKGEVGNSSRRSIFWVAVRLMADFGPQAIHAGPFYFWTSLQPQATSPMATASLFRPSPPPQTLPRAARKPHTLIPFHTVHHSTHQRLLSPLRHFREHLTCALPHSRSASSTPSLASAAASITSFATSLTPLSICKYSLFAAAAVSAAKALAAIATNPFLYTNLSILAVLWPFFAAAIIAGAGILSYFGGRQFVAAAAAVAWLTVVPAAQFNGFLEGWPVGFFFVYLYFLMFEPSVRQRMYGDLLPRPHDAKWDVAMPVLHRAAFAIFVLVGHWLAAYEGPELHLVPGGWANAGIWVLIAVTLFMRYHAVLYLAKYSENVVVPMAVVQFGPYRWVRHPVYASVMLLFATYCAAMRAPLSGALLTAGCALYYGRKAAAEEALMSETFGDGYAEYKKTVPCRLIPLVY